jgi:hypothetical protein
LTDSPITQLARQIESALAARRTRLEERLLRVEQALKSYRLAAEARLAKEFAGEHGFKQQAGAAPSVEQAAEQLLAAVRALPELELTNKATAPASAAPTAARAEAKPAAKSAGTLPAKPAAPEPIAPTEFPLLARAVEQNKRLVVVGALSGRDRAQAMPPELALAIEWIDTEREGAHAIGNLPQRVRQGRVAALVILHRAVGHRHTEAVTAAARDRDIPLAFAGQGGKASLQRALVQLELSLSQRDPASERDPPDAAATRRRTKATR